MEIAQHRLHSEIEESHWWFLARRRIVCDLVRRCVPPSKDKLIVDLGCGTGGNLAALAGDYACAGIDAAEEAVRLARSRYPQIRFAQGLSLDAIGPDKDRVSLVLLMDVLEHLEDDRGFLAALVAALPRTGQLLITVPADPSLWSVHDRSFGHFRRYVPSTLSALWEDLPVEARLLSYYNSRLYPVVKAVRSLNRLRGRASGAAGTDFKTPPGPANAFLEAVFAGESRVLAQLLERRRSGGYSRGVSLIAVLRKS